MKKKTRKSKRQRVALVAALLSAVLTVSVFFVYFQTVDRFKKQDIEEKNAQVQEYTREIERITQEIDAIKVRIKKLDHTGKQMSMAVFAQCTTNLYDDIFPVSKKTGGVFVVNKEENVGLEGCITLAQYDEMLASGWTAAVSAPKTKITPQEYIDSMREHFESIGREMPRAYYFPVGTFTKEGLEFAVANGFETFLYCVDEPYADKVNTEMTEESDPVFIPYLFMSVSQKVFEKFDSITSGGGCCALATRYAVSRGEAYEKEYDSFIANVKDVYDTITEEYKYVRTVKAYREEIYASKVTNVALKAELQSDIRELTVRKDELNRKIVEILGSELES
jgi:cell division protein FtsL